MAVNQDYQQYVEDQLSGFGPILIKRMFGGVGLFKEALMFALIGHDTLHFKVDETNQHEYESRGMEAFMSDKAAGKKGLPYWRVPVEILEDPDALCQWAATSYEIAVKLKK